MSHFLEITFYTVLITISVTILVFLILTSGYTDTELFIEKKILCIRKKEPGLEEKEHNVCYKLIEIK